MDQELIERARQGDREAFALIIDASFDRCYEIARRVLGESHLAQDATQQAMLSIWRDLPKLRANDRFDAWAYRITVNACYSEAKRARRSIAVLNADDSVHAVADEFGSVVDRDQLERAFSRQKLEHRAVLVLRYYLDLPLGEIAAILEVPTGTVKSRIHNGLRAMRAAIEADSRTSARADAAKHAYTAHATTRWTP